MLRHIQAAPVAAAAGLFALTSSPSANAQSPCGAHYTVQPGDTLYQIAQQCRVSIDAIMQANPSIESPHRIGAGWRLDLDPDDNVERADSSYVIQRGDTLGAIARRQGVTLRTLLDANPGVQPRRLAIGQVITVPIDHPMLQAHLSPRRGRPGESVRVQGEGFRPGTTVRIGAGPPESEWRMLEDVRVEPDGRVDARVEIPEWASSQDQLIFVVAGERGREARARFQVVGEQDEPRRIDVRGRVTRGVECPILTTDDGRVYSLGSGGDIDVRTGVYAHVEGVEADVSYCQQGTPVDVGLFRVVEPHEDARLRRD